MLTLQRESNLKRHPETLQKTVERAKNVPYALMNLASDAYSITLEKTQPIRETIKNIAAKVAEISWSAKESTYNFVAKTLQTKEDIQNSFKVDKKIIIGGAMLLSAIGIYILLGKPDLTKIPQLLGSPTDCKGDGITYRIDSDMKLIDINGNIVTIEKSDEYPNLTINNGSSTSQMGELDENGNYVYYIPTSKGRKKITTYSNGDQKCVQKIGSDFLPKQEDLPHNNLTEPETHVKTPEWKYPLFNKFDVIAGDKGTQRLTVEAFDAGKGTVTLIEGTKEHKNFKATKVSEQDFYVNEENTGYKVFSFQITINDKLCYFLIFWDPATGKSYGGLPIASDKIRTSNLKDLAPAVSDNTVYLFVEPPKAGLSGKDTAKTELPEVILFFDNSKLYKNIGTAGKEEEEDKAA